MKARQREQIFLGRDGSPELQVKKCAGSFLFDSQGRKYVDFTMGWCVGNLGWGHYELTRQIARFTRPDYVSPNFSYGPWAELAALLASIAPGRLTKSFRATGAKTLPAGWQRRGWTSSRIVSDATDIARLSLDTSGHSRGTLRLFVPLLGPLFRHRFCRLLFGFFPSVFAFAHPPIESTGNFSQTEEEISQRMD
jgi:acetylornithine/succinyldiaminopimelate/putrescine aminotransferase